MVEDLEICQIQKEDLSRCSVVNGSDRLENLRREVTGTGKSKTGGGSDRTW